MILRGRRWEKTSLASYFCVLCPISQLTPRLHFSTLPVLRGKGDFRSMEAQTISQQRLTRIFRVTDLFTGNPRGSKRAVLLLNTAHLSLWVKPQESRAGAPHRKHTLQCDLSTACQDHSGVLTATAWSTQRPSSPQHSRKKCTRKFADLSKPWLLEVQSEQTDCPFWPPSPYAPSVFRDVSVCWCLSPQGTC